MWRLNSFYLNYICACGKFKFHIKTSVTEKWVGKKFMRFESNFQDEFSFFSQI